MESWQIRALNLLLGLGKPNEKSPGVIGYTPAKTVVSGDERPYFQRSVPERHRISSRRLSSMLFELEADERSNVHSLMVIKDGVVICECSHPGYSVNTWQLSHSMSKTITGMAIGLLHDRGLIDLNTPVTEFFPELKYKDKRFKNITVENLLSMTSGSTFNEVGSVTEDKWTEAFFESPMLFDAGDDFAYNSMNSYILARIVCKVSGESLTEFVEKRIFAPLHITNYFWEKSPEGTEKGGWGVYLSPESWAKLGIMMLELGSFEGKRILSSDWVRMMTSAHAIPNDRSGDFAYGYHLWVNRHNDEFLFNGMLGQNVWVCPRNNIVVVVTAGNNEMFQNSSTMAIIRGHLSGELRDSFDFHSRHQLRIMQKSFFESRRYAKPLKRRRSITDLFGITSPQRFDNAWGALLNKTYALRANHVGLLPLFVRCMQNNLDAGIRSFHFERSGDALMLTVIEGNAAYALEVGIYEYKFTTLDFRGEKYIVGVMGHATDDEHRHAIYKLEFLFPELPNTRKIKISVIDKERILISFSEDPDDKIIQGLFEVFPVTNPRVGIVIDLLENRIGDNFISSKIEDVFNPQFISADFGSPSFDEIMKNEEKKASETSSLMKTLSSIVTRLSNEFEELPENRAEQKQKSLIRNILSMIKKKKKPAGAQGASSEKALLEDVNAALINIEKEEK